jgi:hypothetical protein
MAKARRVHATVTLKPWTRPLSPLLRLQLRSASGRPSTN